MAMVIQKWTGCGGTSALEATASLQLKSLGMECATYAEGDIEEDSLEGIDNLPSEIDEQHNGCNGNGQIEEASQVDRDVVSFFHNFLPHSSPGSGRPPLQPITELQLRYNALQHRLDKRAQFKSIKGWFQDKNKRRGDDHNLWWTSEINVPDDIAAMFRVRTVHSSGKFQLTSSEMEALTMAHDGKEILLEICGEYRISPSSKVAEFKSKKNAQKCSALNLLLAIDLGELPYLDCTLPDTSLKENAQSTPDGMEREGGISSCEEILTLPKGRFKLENIQYHGVLRNSEGAVLSPENPCMVQCTVLLNDTQCNDLNEAALKLMSDFHQNEDDSLTDVLDKIRPALFSRRASANDVHSALSAIRQSKPAIAYEMTIPKWAKSALESQLYLYELEFCLRKDGGEIPLSEAMGLGACVATRIGVICGCDLYDDGHAKYETDLSAECTFGSNGNVCVTMCNRTEITFAKMVQQVKSACLETGLDEDGSLAPIDALKCFNVILFDHGKTYGLGPNPVWADLLKRLNEDQGWLGNRRTNLFLPLRSEPQNDSHTSHRDDIEIDWQLVWDVVHYKTKLVEESPFVSTSCVLVLSFFAVTCYAIWGRDVQRSDWTFSGNVLFAAGISAAIHSTKSIPSSPFLNRFLLQPTLFGKRVFVAKNEEPEQARCLVHLLCCLFKTRWHECNMLLLNKLRQCYMRCPTDPLIPAQLLTGVTYAQHELTLLHQLYGQTFPNLKSKLPPKHSMACILAARGLLVPELTLMLPMPRDMIYMCRHAPIFMLELERAYTLRDVALRLRELQQNVEKPLNAIQVPIDEMARLIGKATLIHKNADTKTLVIRDHERLEILGDSVLLHFIVLNLFVKMFSSNVDHVLDIFELVTMQQGSNKFLFKAAMRIGLPRVLSVGNVSSTKAWRSICNTSPKEHLTNLTHCALTNSLSKKQLSDSFESILGATYLLDANGSMAIGFLNTIGSFLSKIENDVVASISDEPFGNQAQFWFTGEGTCLKEGYPLNAHSGLAAELTKIRSILQGKAHIFSQLESSVTAFCQVVNQQSNHPDQIELLRQDQTASLLLYCALFDDSLDDQECNTEFIDLESFAKLRDKIFHVGNAALQLSIVSEMYHLYPTSTSGDIHFMKVVLASADTLAYIFVKNGLHECMFDKNADAPILMQNYMKESDSLGTKEWMKRGGWIFPGGADEFLRRLKHDNGNHPQKMMKHPRYMGLAAGRLWGHHDKLPDEASGDLQFSMKCIFGSLVLTFGMEDAWDMIRPFFLELMLLSPEELRVSYKNISPIVTYYGTGRC